MPLSSIVESDISLTDGTDVKDDTDDTVDTDGTDDTDVTDAGVDDKLLNSRVNKFQTRQFAMSRKVFINFDCHLNK